MTPQTATPSASVATPTPHVESAPVDYAAQSAHLTRPYIIVGVIITIASVIFTIATFPEILALLFGAVFFVLGLTLIGARKIHCGRCGYVGSPRVEGGSTTVALFLFCFFLIPGIIYVALNGNRYYCRKCNQQGH